MSKEREPACLRSQASGATEEPAGRPERLPKSGAMAGAAGRQNASFQRFSGCRAAKTSKHFPVSWA